MAAMEISGHHSVYRHVLTTFELTNEFIETNKDSREAEDEIKDKIY